MYRVQQELAHARSILYQSLHTVYNADARDNSLIILSPGSPGPSPTSVSPCFEHKRRRVTRQILSKSFLPITSNDNDNKYTWREFERTRR